MNDAKSKVYDLLTQIPALAGWTIIHANGNGQKPARPFASIVIADQVRTPWQEGTLEAPDPIPTLGQRQLTARETFQLRLSMYADNADAVADRLGFELQESEAAQLLNIQLGLGWQSTTNVSDLPELRDDLTFEPRIIFTANGNHVLSYAESVAIIETVNADIDGIPISVTLPP